MKKTTLCYIMNNGCWLLMYRDRKPGDMNEGKWVGVGGKLEPGETPEECNLREVEEETGLRLRSAVFHGVVRFRSAVYEAEDMYLFSSQDFEPADMGLWQEWKETGEYRLPDCDEGELRWVPEEEVASLPAWEGDRAFLEKLLAGDERISMTLSYDEDGHCAVIDDTE